MVKQTYNSCLKFATARNNRWRFLYRWLWKCFGADHFFLFLILKPIERLWRSVKYNYVYIKIPSDGLELYHGFKEHFNYYNNELGHQGIDNHIPVNLYFNKAA